MPPNIYPQIQVTNNANPNKWWAFPLFGGIVKIFSIYGQLYGVVIAMFVILPTLGVVNSLSVLFTGRYWKFYHEQIQSFSQFYAEVMLFVVGVTDRYPSFRLSKPSESVITVLYPENPNRLFAIPVVGGVVRVILLIPFLIYLYIINLAAGLAYGFSFLVVLIAGRYPETTFEFSRDSLRLGFSAMHYMSGISDKYPSFWISMNHKVAKILLIGVGVLYVIFYFYSISMAIKNGDFNKSYKSDRKMSKEEFNQYFKDMPKSDTQYNDTNTQYQYNNTNTQDQYNNRYTN